MDARLDRRSFFRRMAGERLPQRPPWARLESAFAAACDGCGDCIRACPQAILVPAGGGLPAVDFSRGGCTFCGDCAGACTRGAFESVFESGATPWSLIAHISDACLEPQGIACRVCETACDAAALRFRPMPGGRAQVIVADGRCTGCGACVAVCPVTAITVAPPEPHAETEESAA